MFHSQILTGRQPVHPCQTFKRRLYHSSQQLPNAEHAAAQTTQSGMDNNQQKVVSEDNQKHCPNRYPRLLLDHQVVMERGGTPSAVIADLKRKGPANEALAMGADDPVICNLLSTFD